MVLSNIMNKIIKPLSDEEYEKYIMGRHVNDCREGYIWKGGMFVCWWDACRYCNKDVAMFEYMLKDKSMSLSGKVIIKDRLEKAKIERANRYAVV